MAVTLESIMRLNDEYTATMSKIINSAKQYEKTQKSAEKATSTFQQSFKSAGACASSAAAGFDKIALKIGGIVTASYAAKKAVSFLLDVIKQGAQQQVQKNTLIALMGDKTLGGDLYDVVSTYAKNSAMSRSDLANGVNSFLAYTHNGDQLKQLMDLTQRLYMWNPEQGSEGAVFALKEVLGGQTTSLKNRFNINGISAEKVTGFYNKGDTKGLIDYLDKALNKAGATQEVVDENFKSLTVQANNFGKNFTDAISNQANPAVQSLTQTLIDLNGQMEAGDFDGFFNAVANAANNLALAGAWLAKNWQTVVPAISAVIGAFTIYTMAAKTIKFVTETLDIAVSAVTGNWIKLGLAIAGAIGGWALSEKLLGSGGDTATKQMQTYQEAMKKYEDDLKKQQNTAGNKNSEDSVNTNVTNSSPIKVSGTVEIEKENLKYMFEAATAKFYAQFNATKVEPTVTIQNQNVTQTADVNDIDNALGSIVAGRANVSAGGVY